MEFPEQDLKKIIHRKIDFVRKYGAHDIVTDIDYLITELVRYRRKEFEDGFLTQDDKNLIAAFRHLSGTHVGNAYNPDGCSQCAAAKQIMIAIREGKM